MYFYAKALKNTSSISTHIFHQTRIPIRHRPVPNVLRSSPVYTFSSLRNHWRFIPHQTLPDESMPACIRNWRGTYARIRRTGDGVGALKFRLKRRSVEKHIRLRRSRCGSSPRGNVVVERRSDIKHIFISVTFSVFQLPMSWLNAEAERNISFISVTFSVFQLPMSWLNAEADKTYYHISHFRCVPTPNVLVERRSLIKHSIHISHFLCVPLRNVAVECTFTRQSLEKHFQSYPLISSTKLVSQFGIVP